MLAMPSPINAARSVIPKTSMISRIIRVEDSEYSTHRNRLRPRASSPTYREKPHGEAIKKWKNAERNRNEEVPAAKGRSNTELVTPADSGVPGGPLSAKVETCRLKSLLSSTIAPPETRCTTPMSWLNSRSRPAVRSGMVTERGMQLDRVGGHRHSVSLIVRELRSGEVGPTSGFGIAVSGASPHRFQRPIPVTSQRSVRARDSMPADRIVMNARKATQSQTRPLVPSTPTSTRAATIGR